MNQLQRTLTSLEVAEMVGREHGHVNRDIDNIIEHLGGKSKIGESYFIESSYKNSQNKELRCFLLTKKGCELFATRMTGEKGTLFAFQYIEKFNDMEQQINKPMSQLEIAKMQLEQLIKQEQQINQMQIEQAQIKGDINSISEIVGLASDNWRADTEKIINGICYSIGTKEAYRNLRNDIYKAVEEKGGYNLETRLNNLKKRCLEYGVSKSKIEKKNYLDVIQDDQRLKEIYVGIVKQFAIKYKYKGGK